MAETQSTAAAPPAPAPAPNTVSLKIDGQPVTVPKGTNILEAAKTVGADITYFCYHPGLSSPAVCRQCLVEVKGAPKPVPSCYTPVADNMEVWTNSPKALEVRRQMLEFTLTNHPIDCPICDKAGECMLQRHYHAWDHAHSRVDVDKVHKGKMIDIGPEIVLDQERCILCTRCIRVCDEVAGQHQLTMANRGDREILTTAPGEQLDNPYSLNTVDVCPVGALTAKDFRFTMRAWELYTVDSVCAGCATGCNIEVQHAQNQVWRLVPRHNEAVNRHWMCDEGRFTYKELTDDSRVVGASLGGDPAPLDRASAFAGDRIAAARATGSLAMVFGAQATNEDLYLFSKIARALGVQLVFTGGHLPDPERADKILRDADINPNTAGAALFTGQNDVSASSTSLELGIATGKIKALWVIGEDLDLSEKIVQRLGGLDVIVQATWSSELTEAAKVVLPAAAWAEVDGTFTNRQGRVQRIRRAVEARGGSRPHWELTLAVARKLAPLLDDVTGRELAAAIDMNKKENARTLFNQMKAEVKAMAGAEWGPPAPLVQLRFAGSRG